MSEKLPPKSPGGARMPDDLDMIWKALADQTRRAILDLLRDGPLSTTQIVAGFPQMTRFGVMKHLDVLREAGLVSTREEGRQRLNSLNAAPIRRIYERWVSRYEEFWADQLLRLREDFLEDRTPKRVVRDKQQTD